MSITVRLTAADLAALAAEQRRFQTRTSTALQIYARTRVVLWLLFFAGLALAVVATLALLPAASPLAQTATILAAVALLWLALFGVVGRRLDADTARAGAREQAARHDPLETVYDFDDRGITFQSPNGALRFGWHDVQTVIEADQRLFFFLPGAASFVLPLAGLSAEQRDSLFALIQARRSLFADNDPADLGTR
jgi:small-conductance mechanosensitive channel